MARKIKTKSVRKPTEAELRAQCVASVARALDRGAACLADDLSPGLPRTLLQHVAGVLVYGSCEAMFDWPAANARAFAMAFALHAPECELERLTELADDEYSWVTWWDAPGGGKYQGARVKHEQDERLVVAANKLLDMRPAPAGLAVAS